MSTERVEKLLAELTLDEKCALTVGSDTWHSTPIERLGIPSFKMTDGPNGARGDSESGATAACFPVGSALAASWNTQLIGEIGAALAVEAKSKGAQVLLAPTVNLQRTPIGGRNFECYSEDPYLTGAIACAYIDGLQANGVGACIKHYVANDTEFERHTISAEIDEGALRELYLAPFEMAVKRSDPWSIMAAYNRIGGTYACSHRRLLTEILRNEWDWHGVVVSDWGAVQDTIETGSNGLDLEMPGPGTHLGAPLARAVENGDVPEGAVDSTARRILALLERAGRFDEPGESPETSDDRPEHRELARRAAVEGMVLLKNEGPVLPLDASSLSSLAVIGPNAEVGVYQGGGSSQVLPHHVVHPLEAIRERVGSDTGVTHEPGALIHRFLPEIESALLSPPAETGGDRPVVLTYRDDLAMTGDVVVTKQLRKLGTRFFFVRIDGLADMATFGSRYETRFTPASGGLHQFSLCASGRSRLLIDGVEVVDNWTAPEPGEWMYGFASKEVFGSIELEAGASHELVVEYGRDHRPGPVALRVGHLPPVPTDLFERAVRAAADADAAVLIVGTNGEWESEGYDRADMSMPGNQAELIRAVAAAQPATAVILNAGSPVDLRHWLDAAPAVVQAWFPGQEFGHALADVLFGDAEPSGHLPFTYPWRVEDCPAYPSYPGKLGQLRYGDGRFMGYRGYDTTATDVAFPFGHGLGYTTFDWGSPAVECDADGDSATVTLRVTNTGRRRGSDVVQVYVGCLDPGARRPDRELKGFTRVTLDPDESQTVEVVLDWRPFTRWDSDTARWRAQPGLNRLDLGRSSRDIVSSVYVSF